MKLWQKHPTSVNGLVEQFTIGRDPEFDLLLAPYDIQGSSAHVCMLASVGLLTKEEEASIQEGLEQIMQSVNAGSFVIEPGVEDVHSQIELLLTRSLGPVGKKIHSGRSRNDQVAVDIKLFLRAEIQAIRTLVSDAFDCLLQMSEHHKDDLLPGYTHMQLGMPSSFGLWFAAYAESLVDDMELLLAAYKVVNKNPLGSGAGYGSSFPLDRALTTRLLHFRDLHHNAVYAQMSRGKTEKFVANALAAIGATLARLAMDICLYMNQQFAFISFPDSLTTGSSIMPHKKNPDIFELLRAKCNRIQAIPNELSLLLTNLPSGYHRDLQLTKEVLFPAISSLKECLQILCFALPQMQVAEGLLSDDRYKYLFTVESVHDLVRQGLPFRDAYREVGAAVELGTYAAPPFHPAQHTHEGSMGNLCNEQIREAMNLVVTGFHE
jgi:argininosuccinate lyase